MDIRISPVATGDRRMRYDVAVVAAGYESRSRYIVESFGLRADLRLACAFPDRHVLAFDENVRQLRERGYHVDEVGDDAVRDWLQIRLEQQDWSPESGRVTMAVDVSSMSRTRIAAIVQLCRTLDLEYPLEVDFFYSLARFTPPPSDYSPNAHVGPVLQEFAGWSAEPDLPPVVILGFGYEQDRALGAVEHLQPGEVWAFVPRSEIDEYSQHVFKANKVLFQSLPQQRLLSYRVERPFDCFALLESLVFGAMDRAMPVLLPFGPKIFSLTCLLVAVIHAPAVSVWRVSAGIAEVAVDRMPSGSVTCIRVRFTSPVAVARLESTERAYEREDIQVVG